MKIKIITVAIVAVILVSACAFAVNGVTGFPQPEDWINREDDCGFTGPKPAKTTAVKATPKPRVTVRR